MRIYDPMYIMTPGLRDLLISTCEEEKIPYQIYVAKRLLFWLVRKLDKTTMGSILPR